MSQQYNVAILGATGAVGPKVCLRGGWIKELRKLP